MTQHGSDSSPTPIGPDSFLLAGRVAVVTGAAQGIGAETAMTLARLGADVALCDREEQGLDEVTREVEKLGRRCVRGLLDVRDADAVERWTGEVVAELQGIDILVNNAGGGFYAGFAGVSEKGQRALVDENFTSVTNFIRSSLPHLREGASIVNVTSIEASRAAPGFAIYAAMKAAVENLTKSLALELAPRRIRVNAVAPDAIPTPGDESLGAAVSGDEEVDYGHKVPLGWGHVRDCAGAVAFLGCEASTWITGTILRVDGGSSAASGWTRRDDGSYGH